MAQRRRRRPTPVLLLAALCCCVQGFIPLRPTAVMVPRSGPSLYASETLEQEAPTETFEEGTYSRKVRVVGVVRVFVRLRRVCWLLIHALIIITIQA